MSSKRHKREGMEKNKGKFINFLLKIASSTLNVMKYIELKKRTQIEMFLFLLQWSCNAVGNSKLNVNTTVLYILYYSLLYKL